MAQDFAKQRSSQKSPGKPHPARQAAKKSSPQAGSHWSWFFTGLLSGLFVAFIAYLGLLKEQGVSAELASEINAGDLPAAGAETAQAQFDFYEYLPEAEVQVNVVPVEVASQQTGEVDDILYLLQAGSFQVKDDAERHRGRIILLNMDASVVPAVVSGKTWHRVQVGPFLGRRSVEAAIDRLSSNNIDTVLLRMK